MAFQIDDMAELLSELTCVKCNKFLSVFPIYTMNGGSICGRCKDSIEWMISSNGVVRGTSYEAVAKHILFPCINRDLGCKLTLKSSDVENHEKICEYQSQIPCPFTADASNCASECDWRNTRSCLRSHLRSCHSTEVVSNPHTFKLSTNESNVRVNFMEIDLQTTFIILTRYEKSTNKFYCLVMWGGEKSPNMAYSYKLEVGQGDEYFINLQKVNIKLLQDTSEALKNVDKMIMVDVGSAVDFFSNLDYNLQCKMTIIKRQFESKLVPAASTSCGQESYLETKPFNEDSVPVDDCKQKLLESNNELILEKLKCTLCNDYMSNVYTCTQKHDIFCGNCKPSICPVCQLPIPTTSFNCELQALVKKALYPCTYLRYGCTDLFKTADIWKHELQCKYRTICPIAFIPPYCIWFDSVRTQKVYNEDYQVFTDTGIPIDIGREHINQKHIEYLLKNNSTYGIHLKESDSTCYYVSEIPNNSFKDWFTICFKSSSTTGLRFNFLHVGMRNSTPQYKCTLTFVDQTNKGLVFSISQSCKMVPSDTNDFFKNCLEVPLNLLEPYISKSEHSILFYNFNFEKI